jgi:hypothetical protein
LEHSHYPKVAPFADQKKLPSGRFSNSRVGQSSNYMNISESENDSSEPENESEPDDQRDDHFKPQPPKKKPTVLTMMASEDDGHPITSDVEEITGQEMDLQAQSNEIHLTHSTFDQRSAGKPNERAQKIVNNNSYVTVNNNNHIRINSGTRADLTPTEANLADMTNNSMGLQVSVSTATTMDISGKKEKKKQQNRTANPNPVEDRVHVMKNNSEVFEDSLTRYKKSKNHSPSKGTLMSMEDSPNVRSEDDEESGSDAQDEEINTQKKHPSEDLGSQGKLAVIKEEKIRAKKPRNLKSDPMEEHNI